MSWHKGCGRSHSSFSVLMARVILRECAWASLLPNLMPRMSSQTAALDLASPVPGVFQCCRDHGSIFRCDIERGRQATKLGTCSSRESHMRTECYSWSAARASRRRSVVIHMAQERSREATIAYSLETPDNRRPCEPGIMLVSFAGAPALSTGCAWRRQARVG